MAFVHHLSTIAFIHTGKYEIRSFIPYLSTYLISYRPNAYVAIIYPLFIHTIHYLSTLKTFVQHLSTYKHLSTICPQLLVTCPYMHIDPLLLTYNQGCIRIGYLYSDTATQLLREELISNFMI